MNQEDPDRQSRVRSRFASFARRARWASQRSPSTPMPIAKRSTSSSPTKPIRLGPAAPAQSYLDAEKLIDCAERSGADAIHPGYGFLAENADFARTRRRGGFDLDRSARRRHRRDGRQAARAAGDEGSRRAVRSRRDRRRSPTCAPRANAARSIWFAARAQSRRRRRRQRPQGRATRSTRSTRPSKRLAAKREAYFKNGTIYAERYLENPKHVELQILADKHGNVVHVGERDCSLQRRHQKLWEEAPATDSPRRARGDARSRRARRKSDRVRLGRHDRVPRLRR